MNDAIFLAFDDAYSLYARACLNSLRANYPSYPQLVVYYNGSSTEVHTFLTSFERLTIVTDHDLPLMEESFNLGEVNTKAVYFKYLCWNARFAQFRNVLYLDTDTLVLKPLTNLFETTEFYAAPNHDSLPTVRIFDPARLADSQLLSMLSQDKLPIPDSMDDMCNAGVLLIPAKYRTPDHFNHLMEITRHYNQFLQYADQSAISLWCKMNNIEFSNDFSFNFQSVHFGCDDLHAYTLDDIHILHFSSRRKPNTVEFMLWQRIPLAQRKRMAQLFMEYLTDKVSA
jgi:lipopolysaccharide biosynthesis glycosyltransferase